jgi:hypothetical protein
VWADPALSPRDRSIATVAALKDGYPFVFAGLWKGGNRLKPKTRPRTCNPVIRQSDSTPRNLLAANYGE